MLSPVKILWLGCAHTYPARQHNLGRIDAWGAKADVRAKCVRFFTISQNSPQMTMAAVCGGGKTYP
jgi:hypothetical protein